MHLMRVIEVGLRILGKHLGPIELKRAIEFEDWRPILTAVEKKIGQLENEPRTAERAERIVLLLGCCEANELFQEYLA